MTREEFAALITTEFPHGRAGPPTRDPCFRTHRGPEGLISMQIIEQPKLVPKDVGEDRLRVPEIDVPYNYRKGGADNCALASSGLHIKFGTRSAINQLAETGSRYFSYAESCGYSSHWSTEVWCCCYALGDGPVKAWHPGNPVPSAVLTAARDGLPFLAYDAGFEHAILGDIMGPSHSWPMPALQQWHCTAAAAAGLGLPHTFEEAAWVMGCKYQDDGVGRHLVLKIMQPRRIEERICSNCSLWRNELDEQSRLRDGWGCYGETEPDYCFTRLVWWDDPELIARGTAYCMRRLEAERDFARRVPRMAPLGRAVWLLGQALDEHSGLTFGEHWMDSELVRKAVQDFTGFLGADIR
jgi:hypothetical protein